MKSRTSAMLHGAMMALGAAAVVDIVVVHWGLRLHRALSGPLNEPVEGGVVILGILLLAAGWLLEARLRSQEARMLEAQKGRT